MKCKKCGYVSEEMITICPKCGSNELENDFINGIKCPKCGYQNYMNKSICKNCEYPLNEHIEINNQVNNINEDVNVEISAKKSILTFAIFSIIYTFIPLIIVIMAEGTMLSNISFLILVFGIEPLTCLTIKKIVKSTKYMKSELLTLSFLLIMLWSIPFLMPNMGMEQDIPLIMIFIRIIVWFITRKIFIKDKIVFSKKIFLTFIMYVVCIFLVSSFAGSMPTNKLLFKTFGSTEFSSKELYIEIVNMYNLQPNTKDKVSYMHKLTKEQLKKINGIDSYLEAKITTNDLEKLPNLKSLSISEDVKLDKKMDFSSNKKLEELNIFSSGVEEIVLPNSIKKLNTGKKSIIKDLDVSNLSKLSKISGTFNVLTISDLSKINNSESSIVVNKLITKSNQSIELSNKKKIIFNFSDEYEDYIYLPEHTKVNDVMLENLNINVTNYSGKITSSLDEEMVTLDILFLYDNNNNIINRFKVRIER